MPSATFSRRNAPRRQASSDIEEEPTQRRGREAVDDEEDEDERPRRHTNGIKKEKKATSSRRVARRPENGNDKDDDDDEDDDDRIDVENFHDQPLGRADLPKLLGLSNEWQQMEKQVQQNWNVIAEVAASVADAAEGADAEAVCFNFLCRFENRILFLRALLNST
jgi:E3 SUMO-protein ligase NSE2